MGGEATLEFDPVALDPQQTQQRTLRRGRRKFWCCVVAGTVGKRAQVLERIIRLTEVLLVGSREFSMELTSPVLEHVCSGIEAAQFLFRAARPGTWVVRFTQCDS